MYVAALGLLRNTATLSEGAPHDSSTDSTTCVGLHYNATHSAGPLALDSAAAIVSTILGPALGTLNLALVLTDSKSLRSNLLSSSMRKSNMVGGLGR